MASAKMIPIRIINEFCTKNRTVECFIFSTEQPFHSIQRWYTFSFHWSQRGCVESVSECLENALSFWKEDMRPLLNKITGSVWALPSRQIKREETLPRSSKDLMFQLKSSWNETLSSLFLDHFLDHTSMNRAALPVLNRLNPVCL